MEIKRSSADFEIIDSGSIITFDSTSDISLAVNCGADFNFVVKFIITSTGCSEHKITPSVNGTVISFDSSDCNNAIGIGTIEPIELASYDEKKIYVNFWVYDLGSGSLKKIDYTVYYG